MAKPPGAVPTTSPPTSSPPTNSSPPPANVPPAPLEGAVGGMEPSDIAASIISINNTVMTLSEITIPPNPTVRHISAVKNNLPAGMPCAITGTLLKKEAGYSWVSIATCKEFKQSGHIHEGYVVNEQEIKGVPKHNLIKVGLSEPQGNYVVAQLSEYLTK